MQGIILVAVTSVFLQGRIIAPGTEFSCDLSFARKLIDGGSAKLKEIKAQGSLDLEDLTTEKLKELAKKHGIGLENSLKKAEIIKKIIASGVIIDEKDL